MPTRIGRKSKLTRELATTIAASVEQGIPVAQAATLVGVGPATVHEWLQRGTGTHPTRPRTGAYADFAAAVKKAEAVDEMQRLQRLNAAAKGGAWCTS